MTKLVIFDKDGVILDLGATWLPVARAVAGYTVSLIPVHNDFDRKTTSVSASDLLEAVGVNNISGYIDPKGLFAAGSFQDIRAQWQSLLPADMIDLENDPDYRDKIKNIVSRESRNTTIPKGDVVTPLRALQSEGYELAVVTNDDEGSARQNFQDLGITNFFCAIVGANSGHGAKPEPYGLLHCCEVAGVPPQESIMVGDTIADYYAALAAGCNSFICIADDYEDRPHHDILPENVIANLMGLPLWLSGR